MARTSQFPQYRTPLGRFQLIVAELMRGPQSAKTLAGGMEVSIKTVFRDLHYMRDMLNIPIESSCYGWKLTGAVCLCATCASATETKAVLPRYAWAEKALSEVKVDAVATPAGNASVKPKQPLKPVSALSATMHLAALRAEMGYKPGQRLRFINLDA